MLEIMEIHTDHAGGWKTEEQDHEIITIQQLGLESWE